MANLLLISNSTNAGEEYLAYAMPHIEEFLKKHGAKSALFIPYAGVTISWDDYYSRVKDRFDAIGVELKSIHNGSSVEEVDAVVVGGGNTFNLLKCMQENKIMDSIRTRVLEQGMPYIGWSAGSVVASPTMCTTNDMPIVEPLSFKALELVPFQINPHYTEAHPEGHAGETRQMRIAEYIEANKETTVVGLREGCMIEVEGDEATLIGSQPVTIFHYGTEQHVMSGSLSSLLNK